jgi:hypothetical protein
MKTACKILLALTLICTMPGCCSWCGRGCDLCSMTAPGCGNCPVAAAATPKMGLTRPFGPPPDMLAGEMTPPQVTMR